MSWGRFGRVINDRLLIAHMTAAQNFGLINAQVHLNHSLILHEEVKTFGYLCYCRYFRRSKLKTEVAIGLSALKNKTKTYKMLSFVTEPRTYICQLKKGKLN